MKSIEPQTPSQTRLDFSRLDFIDALRGFAMLGVIAVHATGLAKPHGILQSFAESGARGVQLFFIISAFTMFYTLTHSKRASDRSWVAFFSRRFFRIAPLYYIVLLTLTPPHMKFSDLIYHFTFINAWMPSKVNSALSVEWSIALEMNFYLIVPLLFAGIRGLRSAIVFTLLGVATCLLSISYLEPELMKNALNESDRYNAVTFARIFSLMAQLSLFGLGFVFFFQFQRMNAKLQDRSAFSRKLESGFWLFVSALGYYALLSPKVHNYAFPYHVVWGYPMLATIYALLLWPWRVFVNGLTKYLGKVSYSCYLIHIFIIYRLQTVVPPEFRQGNRGYVMMFLLTVSIAVVLGTISFYLIEKPGQSIGRWLTEFVRRRIFTRPETDAASADLKV